MIGKSVSSTNFFFMTRLEAKYKIIKVWKQLNQLITSKVIVISCYKSFDFPLKIEKKFENVRLF